MLRDGPTEPMIQRGMLLPVPGAARAAQTIQAEEDVQDTMKTIADQLLVLLDEIPGAGRIQQERRAMHQHIQTYFRIADGVWEALATEQMYELAGNRAYTVAVDTLEQKLIKIHETCMQAKQDPNARGGWFWRRRVRLYSQSLLDWKRCVESGAGGSFFDTTTCGRVLYRAHGRVGLAGLSGFNYLLVRSLPILGVLASLLLAFVFGAVAVTQSVQGHSLIPTVLSSLIALYILWFSTTGPSPLPVVVGYALERRQPNLFARALRVTGIIEIKPGLLRSSLRVLLALLGTLFLAGLIALLALGVLLVRAFFLNLHSSAGAGAHDVMITLLQSSIRPLPALDPNLLLIAPPVLCLSMIALFFLPFTLSVQARMTRTLLTHPERSAEARRYALRPALELLSFHIITLYVAALLANSFWNFGATPIWPALPVITWRLLIYIAALVLPYLLLIDLPYRQGITRWRASRRRELARWRNEIAQRLSHAAPQPADQTDLRAIQDYLTWQYYRSQEEEVKATPSAPFPIERGLLALALTIITGFLLDWINGFLHGLL
jgi:hypothetical protein